MPWIPNTTKQSLIFALKTNDEQYFFQIFNRLTAEDKARLGRIRIWDSNEHRFNLFYFACKMGNAKIVEALLTVDSIKLQVANYQNLAFRLSAGYGHTAVMKLLLQHPSVRNTVTAKKYAAFDEAVKFNHAEVMLELLSLPEFSDHLDEDAASSNYYLFSAVKQGNLEAVKILLANARVRQYAANYQNRNLYNAVQSGNAEMVQQLLKVDSIRGACSQLSPMVLFKAIHNKHFEVVKLLLKVPKIHFELLRNEGKKLRQILERLNFFCDTVAIDKFIDLLHIYNFPLRKITNASHKDFLDHIYHYCLSPEYSLKEQPLSVRQAVRIFHTLHLVREYEAMNAAISSQEAGNYKKVKVAMAQYEIIKLAFKDRFTNIKEIERDIRALLLDRILMVANENVLALKKSDKDASKQLEIIDFVKKNYQLLTQGDHEELMANARAYFNSNLNIYEVAWRAFDKWAPHEPKWPNLLSEQLSNIEEVYSIREVREENVGKLSSIAASNIAREFICFSFLLVTDPNEPELMQDRIEHFFAQIKDIRRAHNPTENGVDDPSCLPGIIDRGRYMWMKHSLAIKDLFDMLIPQILSQIIVSRFIEKIKENPKENELLYHSLIMLRKENAEDILSGKADYAVELAQCRQRFIDELGTQGELIARINAALSEMKAAAMEENEYVYVLKYLADIGGFCCDALTSAFSRESNLHQSNPYTVLPEDRELYKPTQLEHLSKQSAAWEILIPIVNQYYSKTEIGEFEQPLINAWVKCCNEGLVRLALEQKIVDLLGKKYEVVMPKLSHAYALQTRPQKTLIHQFDDFKMKKPPVLESSDTLMSSTSTYQGALR